MLSFGKRNGQYVLSVCPWLFIGCHAYEGVYFGGSKELALNLPRKQIDVITFKSSIELGAFGGVNESRDNVYLAIGATGTVAGRLQIPKGSPVFAGK